jgi:hypothetical protein
MSFFSWNGSPTCTEGRLSAEPSPNVAEARIEAPPMPSRPVAAPSSTATWPGDRARASTRSSRRSRPKHITLTSGLAE